MKNSVNRNRKYVNRFNTATVYSSVKNRNWMKALKGLGFLAFIFVVSFLVSLSVIMLSNSETTLVDSKYMAVIPGASIMRNGDPSTALKYRLDKGMDFYEQGLVAKFYISGTPDEVWVMKNYLVNLDIPASSIIEDTNGNNTFETVKNCDYYLNHISVDDGAVFISQRYHLTRIKLLAARTGMDDSEFVATDKKDMELDGHIHFLMRESLALIKAFMFDRT